MPLNASILSLAFYLLSPFVSLSSPTTQPPPSTSHSPHAFWVFLRYGAVSDAYGATGERIPYLTLHPASLLPTPPLYLSQCLYVSLKPFISQKGAQDL